MKKIILVILSISMAVLCAQAQGNTFPGSGDVGIGTISPEAPLHVRLASGTSAAYPTTTSKGDMVEYFTANNNGLEFGIARGDNIRRAWILTRHFSTSGFGQYYGTLHLQPLLDVTTQYRGVAIGYPASAIIPLQVGLAVNGNVGIGTINPQAKLAVEGNILAKEIKIKTDISVPDYVFEPEYELRSLEETEAYVREHKHLPEIPSAVDIQRDGLDLAEMNLLLLKKMEEMTLHMIEQEKKEKRMQEILNRMEGRLRELEGKRELR